MARYMKQHSLPEESVWPELRPMEDTDVPKVTELLTTYLATRKVHIQFS